MTEHRLSRAYVLAYLETWVNLCGQDPEGCVPVSMDILNAIITLLKGK